MLLNSSAAPGGQLLASSVACIKLYYVNIRPRQQDQDTRAKVKSTHCENQSPLESAVLRASCFHTNYFLPIHIAN